MTEAGVDEVGRGPIAGPVVAAAVILQPGPDWSGVRDSKRLGTRRREVLAQHIQANARAWAIAEVDAAEIDALNIRQATLLAMQRAVAGLKVAPQRVLVDGRDLPALPCPGEAIVGGDNQVPAIAAASIIAKVYRDAHMRRLHTLYPAYGFDRHSGYPTAEHRARLRECGICPVHRRSFAPVRDLIAAE